MKRIQRMMVSLVLIAFCCLVEYHTSDVAQAQSKVSGPNITIKDDKKPPTRIDFSASDAATIAAINATADTRINQLRGEIAQIDQRRYNETNNVLAPYHIPDNWIIVKDARQNWIGAEPDSVKAPGVTVGATSQPKEEKKP